MWPYTEDEAVWLAPEKPAGDGKPDTSSRTAIIANDNQPVRRPTLSLAVPPGKTRRT